MTPSKAAEDIATLVRAGTPGAPLDCELPDIPRVHELLTESGNAPRVVVMALYERVLVQFPDLSHRLLIAPVKSSEDSYSCLGALPRLEWWGPRGRRPTFDAFLVSEVKSRPLLLGAVLVVTFSVLASVQDSGLMLALNQLAVGSVTIFISIFLIFSVAEAGRATLDLFRAGRIHEFLHIDKHLAQVAVLALVLAFANVVILKLPPAPRLFGIHLPHDVQFGPFVLGRLSFVVPFTTSLMVVLLVDVFLAAVSYYFNRHELLLESEAASAVFRQRRQRKPGVEDPQVTDTSL